MNTTTTLCDDCGKPVSPESKCSYCGGCRPDGETGNGCCSARDCNDCGRLRHDVDDGGLCESCLVADHNDYEATLASVNAALNRAGHKGSYSPRLIRLE